uniref:NHX1 n=1 Tax=Gentiana crassa subsp. rigescens TaxID=3097545 RepID=A0A0A7CBI8_9GENT|nr:NHX1 [Gentiana rigescens]
MGMLVSAFMRLGIVSSVSDEGSIGSLTLCVALLCTCIVLGHFLEGNRWVNGSIVALIIGLSTGTVILLTSKGKNSRLLEFDEKLFFICLLPPIIFNAGFKVKKKRFFRNFLTIMLFGVLGTLISFCIVSFGAKTVLDSLAIGSFELQDYLAIGAVLSATDSVGTLQVLNQDDTPLLYSLVFGEGVVNDAASVVLFKAIQRFDVSQVKSTVAWEFVANFASLFITSTLLGIVIGLLSAYIIKKLYFGRHSTDREVALMILMAYLSYVMSEMFSLSGILTVFFCGIVVSHYTWHNVTQKSKITTKHTFATFSFLAESFIFFYVGMDALDVEKWRFVTDSPAKSVGVSALLFLFVLVGRASFIFPLSLLSNFVRKSKNDKISLKQQVTILWAGLTRGAVSMALAYSQFAKSGHIQQPGNAILITSTITIVLFSTVVFGLLTKPILKTFLASSVYPDPSEPPSVDSQLLLGDERGSEANKKLRQFHRSSSLQMLFTAPTYMVHYYWRKFDDAVMRRVFGGRGFSSYDIDSIEEESVF